MSQPCPCGLTQEQLDRHQLVGPGGVCTAFWKDESALDGLGNRKVCGESLANHPHVQLQTGELLILID